MEHITASQRKAIELSALNVEEGLRFNKRSAPTVSLVTGFAVIRSMRTARDRECWSLVCPASPRTAGGAQIVERPRNGVDLVARLRAAHDVGLVLERDGFRGVRHGQW